MHAQPRAVDASEALARADEEGDEVGTDGSPWSRPYRDLPPAPECCVETCYEMVDRVEPSIARARRTASKPQGDRDGGGGDLRGESQVGAVQQMFERGEIAVNRDGNLDRRRHRRLLRSGGRLAVNTNPRVEGCLRRLRH